MFTPLRRLPHGWALGAALLAAACGPDISLPPAALEVTQQVITLSAISNSPVNTPSGYDAVGLSEVFTQNSSDFDFVFDLGIDSTFGLGHKGDTVAVLLPRGYMGFLPNGGLQTTFVAFDSIVLAPVSGYEGVKPTRIRAGDNVLVASRTQQCQFGILSPRYAKAEVFTIDVAQRLMQMRLIIDPNCGYRQLTSGIPSH